MSLVISDQDLSSSQQWPKRRRSGDSSPSPISSRLVERLPSISKRWKDRRVGLTISTSGSRSVPTSRAASRASSLNGSARPVVEYREQQAPLTPAKSEPDHDFDLLEEPSPLSIDIEKASKDPIDRKALASTPLLPPTMLDLAAARDDSVQSPLQSPSVAEPNRTFSLCNTPAGSPHLFSMPTPPLSSRPSFSSFHRARAASSQQVSSADVGFLELGEINDEWSMKLGHANFMIEPEPYMPAICDLRTCQHLLDDWHQARCNYQKHQVRTGEHYGATSKTYKLTEKKWAEIDACWRANYDLAVVTAAHNGYVVESSTPVEPAPLAKLPSLHDPKSEGKFPKLGDEDIVGPMVQIASQVQPKQSRKASFLKFLGEIKFPGSVLGNKPSSFSPTR
ncbi:MAG: hypothetical protein M1820_000415 [Bogoriella megaspora]|nr:MAG: hypothetical protein M1820_000415 [Bogoriella megaspora]